MKVLLVHKTDPYAEMERNVSQKSNRSPPLVNGSAFSSTAVPLSTITGGLEEQDNESARSDFPLLPATASIAVVNQGQEQPQDRNNEPFPFQFNLPVCEEIKRLASQANRSSFERLSFYSSNYPQEFSYVTGGSLPPNTLK